MHFVEQFVLKDEVILVFYMTLIALESLTDVKYSEIKVFCNQMYIQLSRF